MKLETRILLLALILLGILSCGPNAEPITYKFLPKGNVTISNLDSRFATVKDTIHGPFDIYLRLEEERVYSLNWNLIPAAMAYKPPNPVYLNEINWEKSSISINKSFIYKNEVIEKNKNILKIEPNIQFYNNYLFGYNRIIIDEKFLYYTRFTQDWVIFTISGELVDGQKFKFEKEVYLDL